MSNKIHRFVGFSVCLLRMSRGLSQTKLASQCGVDSQTISRIERGVYEKGIHPETEVICDYFGVSLSDLVRSAEMLRDDVIPEMETTND